MSITKTVDIFCDGEGCNEWGPTDAHTQSARDARAVLRRGGWVHRDGRDLCPRCSEGERK